MRSSIAARAARVIPVLSICAACAGKANYDLSWRIDARELSGGPQHEVASYQGHGLPPEWGITGRDVRVLETTPTTPHDTLGILYWQHMESPLKLHEEQTGCVTVSQPGSVVTTRQCASKIFSVQAQCDEGCRRDIVRAVADSLGADAIIVADETLVFEGLEGEPQSVAVSYARNQGFQGTYVMIRIGSS